MPYVLLLVALAVHLGHLGCASTPEPPAPLAVGSRLAGVELSDQHGVARTLDRDVRVVLFSRDMEGGEIIRALLGSEPGLLEETDGVYVADISGMPGLIARLVAIPRMQERPYPMLLDREGEVTAVFPSQAGRATLLVLDGLEVRAIDHLDTIEALRDRLTTLTR